MESGDKANAYLRMAYLSRNSQANEDSKIKGNSFLRHEWKEQERQKTYYDDKHRKRNFPAQACSYHYPGERWGLACGEFHYG